MKQAKEPIRHHYIPQFILRNFSFDGTDKVHYFDVSSKSSSIFSTRDIFMEKNLYRDEINHSDDPTEIEHDLASFEGWASHLIKEKILGKREISLSPDEDEKLKMFLAVMGLRNQNAHNIFSQTLSLESREFYSRWQNDGNLVDFWKRNLGKIIKHNHIINVLEDNSIDEPFRVFFARDTFGITGSYFVFLERRGPIKFAISDCYPVETRGTDENGNQMLWMYSAFPLSPDQVILHVANGVLGAPLYARDFNDYVLRKPYMGNDGMIHFTSKKIYEFDVDRLNHDVIRHAKVGVVSKDDLCPLP